MRRPNKSNEKPRATGILTVLPEEVQNTIWVFLYGHSLAETAAFVLEKFGVKASVNVFSRWRRWYLVAKPLEGVRTYADGIKVVLKSMPDYSHDRDYVLMSKVVHTKFLLMAAEKLDVETYCRLHTLYLKEQELNFSKEKFQFDAAQAALDNLPALREISTGVGMSSAEKLQKARLALFGVTP